MAERKLVEEYIDSLKQLRINESRLFLTLLCGAIDDNASFRGREVKDMVKGLWEMGVRAADQPYLRDFEEEMRDYVRRIVEQKKPE